MKTQHLLTPSTLTTNILSTATLTAALLASTASIADSHSHGIYSKPNASQNDKKQYRHISYGRGFTSRYK